MPNAEQIRQFLVTVVIPPVSGAVATWLASTQVLAVFHITANAAAAAITQVLVFGVVTIIAYLASHHILSGHYAPAKLSSPYFVTEAKTEVGHGVKNEGSAPPKAPPPVKK